MFEAFDEQAREVIAIATEYAAKYQHVALEPGDLLMGLASVGPSLATRVLDDELPHGTRDTLVGGLPYERLPDATPVGADISFRPESKKVLELALREALSLGSNQVSPHHVLLGLVRNADVAAGLALDPAGIRDAVIALLMKRPSPRHLLAWTAAMEAERDELAGLARQTLELLAGDAVPLLPLRRIADDLGTAADAFVEAIDAAVLPGTPS